jgi:hypothetical protein
MTNERLAEMITCGIIYIMGVLMGYFYHEIKNKKK